LYHQNQQNQQYVNIHIPLHIHFPEGATPKDGPSAGLAITLVIWAFLTRTIIPSTIAMTGEIDLEGNILPVGGISSKLLGAYFQGIHTVILPEDNRRDYELFKEHTTNEKGKELPIQVIFVRRLKDVFNLPFFSSSKNRWRTNSKKSQLTSLPIFSGRPRSYSFSC
jgi:ATP-dependent Lon protease